MIITVIDWDDTLFATTHTLKHNSTTLPKLSLSIKQLLESALSVGSVYIITNANSEWVELCVQRYLVECQDIFENIPVWSTINTGISLKTPLYKMKTVAFEELKHFFLNKPGKHHLISMGDNKYDRDAALSIQHSIGNHVYVKNIKFIEKPSLESLLDQHKILDINFKELVKSDCHIDLAFKLKIR
jgi:hypothetical protein